VPWHETVSTEDYTIFTFLYEHGDTGVNMSLVSVERQKQTLIITTFIRMGGGFAFDAMTTVNASAKINNEDIADITQVELVTIFYQEPFRDRR
jgi:hypothetical protein